MPQLYEKLRFDLSQDIVHLQFVNGAKGNCVDEQMHFELGCALREIQASQQPRALLISGEGKHFSVGGDFDFILKGHESQAWRDRIAHEASEIFYSLSEMEVPVIAAVQGAAVGLGATIATMADIVVTCPQAKFADPHICIGLVAGDGGVVSWAQAIGPMQAKRYLLTGEYLDGARAYALGLATDLVDDPAEVLPAAMVLAEKIRAMPPLGIIGTKRAFNAVARQHWRDIFDMALALEAETMETSDLPALLAQMRR